MVCKRQKITHRREVIMEMKMIIGMPNWLITIAEIEAPTACENWMIDPDKETMKLERF